MVHYKLTYFGIGGRAEALRMMFHHKNIAFEDHQITQQEFAALKPSLPYGVVPVLYVDGKPLSETLAVSHYVASITGLAGADSWEAAQCMMIYGAIEKFGSKSAPFVMAYLFENDEVKAFKVLAELVDDVVKPFLAVVNERLKANGNWLVGKNVTWSDITVAELTEKMSRLPPLVPLFAAHPAIVAHFKRVRDLPGIKEYVAKRNVKW